MQLDDTAINALDVSALLRALREPSWMYRRKDAIKLETESQVSRTHSFDFVAPRDLTVRVGEDDVALVPLGFWWKAPGRYTCIDFVDESDRSLPVSTRDQDGQISTALIFEAASQCLGLAAGGKLPQRLAAHLYSMVMDSAYDAYAEFTNTWQVSRTAWLRNVDEQKENHDGADVNADPVDGESSDADIRTLARDPGFMALLRVCSISSLFVLQMPASECVGKRRIVKLRYDETVHGLEDGRLGVFKSRHQRIYKFFAVQVPLKFGLRPYRIHFTNAFIASQRYHCEVYAPDGLGIAGSTVRVADVDGNDSHPGLEEQPDNGDTPERVEEMDRDQDGPEVVVDPDDSMAAPVRRGNERRVHQYVEDASKDTIATVRVSFVSTSEWLISAIALTVAAGVILWYGKHYLDASKSASSNTAIASTVLLIPSAAMSLLWIRVHWLAKRMQKWLRAAFAVVTAFVFYVAIRVALLPIDDACSKLRRSCSKTELTGINHVEFLMNLGVKLTGLLAALLVVAYIQQRLRRDREMSRQT